MSFHWSCFIVPLRLEICSSIAILVCFSLFYIVNAQKKRRRKQQRKKKERKKERKKEKKKKKGKKKK